ncbi:MAG: 4Fe-4S dicluster domain-containing protein [Bacteroidetes bacterium]|nr:MAG: 4Fe-4S dicluster domain-containing protein [Bacteroidota bacterium]
MMNDEIYRQLQRHLDASPVPFPETGSGVEIRFLKQLFTREEAFAALKLSVLPEPLDRIHRRFRKGEITREELETRLRSLHEKGAILCIPDPKHGHKYSKLPVVVGMFEYQVDRVTKELAEDFFRYEEEGLGEALLKPGTKQMRTVPVNVSLEYDFLVGSYDNARAIIHRSGGPFAVMNCICRQSREKMGHPCRQTRFLETCFTLGDSARYMMSRGAARELSREEILVLLGRAEDEGMVLQPQNTREPGFICCCCGCCCGVLTAAKKFEKPSEFFHTNFYALVDADNCTACETCMERCQMDALVRVNSHTEVLLDRCIGCGVCVNACPSGAIYLNKKERETVPPKNRKAMFMKMVRERYGLLGSLRFMGKAALGRKI